MKASDRGRNVKSKEFFGCFDEFCTSMFNQSMLSFSLGLKVRLHRIRCRAALRRASSVIFPQHAAVCRVTADHPIMQVAVAECLARLTAVWESRFESHRGPGCVYLDNRWDIQPWALAAHLYCSAYVDSVFHPL